MLADPVPIEVKALVVEGKPIEVVVSEDGASPLSLVVPPFEVIAEVKLLQGKHFSIKEWSEVAQAPTWALLEAEHARLAQRYSKFKDSPTYLNRLANLASISGNFVEEEAHLREAIKLGDSQFLSNRLIENLLAAHRDAEAETMLASEDLGTNLYANLRLAAIYVVRKDIAAATERVDAAIGINPLDFSARLFDGALKLWKGEFERAILSFRVAAERRPNSASLHTNLAVAYLGLGRKDKALQSLKIAVAIDPISLNAVNFLADLSHSLKRNEDAVPSLRYFLRYEQKDAGVWGRLARALIGVGESGEAIAALKRQASLEDTSEVWSNLGVAHHIRGDTQKALQCLKHAMGISPDMAAYGFCVAARNTAVLLGNSAPPQDVVKFIDSVVSRENRSLFASTDKLSAIYLVKLWGLARMRETQKAMEFGEGLIGWSESNDDLVCRVATGLLSIYSLNEGGERALQLADRFSEKALHGSFPSEAARSQLLNNIAFVYAEYGRLNDAERHLQAIAGDIHKLPFPTATSGLIHLKKGHLERASALYSEAIRLGASRFDKARIRQKWNLEQGKALLSQEPRRAGRLLTKAMAEADGESGIAKQAAALLNALPRI